MVTYLENATFHIAHSGNLETVSISLTTSQKKESNCNMKTKSNANHNLILRERVNNYGSYSLNLAETISFVTGISISKLLTYKTSV